MFLNGSIMLHYLDIIVFLKTQFYSLTWVPLQPSKPEGPRGPGSPGIPLWKTKN